MRTGREEQWPWNNNSHPIHRQTRPMTMTAAGMNKNKPGKQGGVKRNFREKEE
jgi:hypothetical protein